MNCEGVMDVLDNQRIDRLDPERRRQVDAHLAVCADCARAWNLQVGLASLPDMALPEEFATRCRALVATGGRPAADRSAARRVWWASMVATLAAAMTGVAFLLWPASTVTPDHIVRIVEERSVAGTPDAVPVDPSSAALVTTVSAAPPTAPPFTVRVQLPSEEQIRASDEQLPPTLREAVQAERRANAANPAWGQALRSLSVALFEELRNVPGLKLVQSDPIELPASARHYRLRVDSLQLINNEVVRGGRRIPIVLYADQVQADGTSIQRGFASAVIDLLVTCSTVDAVGESCPDSRGAAAALVNALRRDVFPADSSVTAPLQAKFRDALLDPVQRAGALEELYRLQQRVDSMGPLRDPTVVQSAIELAANADPVLRAQIWRSLRGVGTANLIQPLLASLAQDPEDVRLAALETLAADFLGDARVRAALEAVAAGDARPLVRAVAGRSLSGEETWRQYVFASLKDASRPAAQRLEALEYYLYPPGPTARTTTSHPDWWEIMGDLGDDDTLRALAEALPDAGQLRGNADGILSNVGYRYSRSPAITGMLLRVLESDSRPRNRTIAGEVLARTHGTEPQVRAALNKALRSDPDRTVRDWIRQIMAERPQ